MLILKTKSILIKFVILASLSSLTDIHAHAKKKALLFFLNTNSEQASFAQIDLITILCFVNYDNKPP